MPPAREPYVVAVGVLGSVSRESDATEALAEAGAKRRPGGTLALLWRKDQQHSG